MVRHWKLSNIDVRDSGMHVSGFNLFTGEVFYWGFENGNTCALRNKEYDASDARVTPAALAYMERWGVFQEVGA